MSKVAKRIEVLKCLKETYEEVNNDGVELYIKVQSFLEVIKDDEDNDCNDIVTKLEGLERQLKKELQTFEDNYEDVEMEIKNEDNEQNQWNILKAFRQKRDAARSALDNCFEETEALDNEYLQTIEINEQKNEEEAEKVEEACETVYELYMDLQIPLYELKQEIENIFEESQEQYIDKDDMEMELSQSLEEIENLLEKADDNYETALDFCDECEDINNLYQIVYNFKNQSEELKQEINNFEEKIIDIFERYSVSPEAKLSRLIREKSEQLGLKLNDVNGLNIFKLPLQETFQDKKNCLRRFELGDARLDKSHRYVIFMGMTGSGKSLQINNIINYIYGVRLKDKFRFKLIDESEELSERAKGSSNSQAESMTSWVSSYTFHWQEGFRIPFSLTVIDTPGFGDTRGLEYDEKIIDQMRKFFKSEDLFPFQELTCLALVMQASQARITEEQKYILDQILNIFGKDMSENIFILFTFADAQPPPALEVVKINKIPFNQKCTFKFNNSALFAANDKDEDISLYAWDFGYKSLEKYFEALRMKDQVSLELTKQVLEERERLRIYLSALQGKIITGVEMLQSIEVQSDTILKLNGTMKANENFKVKKTTYKCEPITVDHSITNCSQCSFTCHDPCNCSTGDLKSGCSAMRRDYCVVCPSKCHYSKHTNGTKIYKYTPVVIEETIKTMMKRYKVAGEELSGKKKILVRMLKAYKEQRKEVLKYIQEANRCANQLEKISLRSSYLSNIQFIERLIQSEEHSNRPKRDERLKHLRNMKDMAETLRDVKKNPAQLTGNVSEYESKILQIINKL